MLAGCESTRSDDDDRRGPASLSGTTITFSSLGGATLSFVAARGQTAGIETGGISDYDPGLAGEQTFTNVSTGAQSVGSFPDSFINGSYTFTPIGESSGRIEFFGNSTLDLDTDDDGVADIDFDIFGNSSAATPIVLNVLFADNGTAFIQNLELNLELVSNPATPLGSILLAGADNGDFELTDTGELVPVGFDTDRDGPSELNSGTFDGTTLLISDANTLATRNFLFDATDGGSSGDITETGTTLVIDSVTGQNFEGVDYEVEQPDGTDNVFLDIDFTSGTGTTLPPSIVYTLTFTSITFGTYTANDGSNGTFILDVD